MLPFLLTLLTTLATLATPPPPAAVTLESARPYLAVAANDRYCNALTDPFDRRSCQTKWQFFRTRMLAWARTARLVDDDVAAHIGPYDLAQQVFPVVFEEFLVGSSEFDLLGLIGVGAGKCDLETGSPVLRQVWPVRVATKVAETSVLRAARGSQVVSAVLTVAPAELNWCCSRVLTRMARLNQERCRLPRLALTVTGWQLTLEDTFATGARVPDAPMAFDPAVLGCEVPTGDGEFGAP